MAGTQHRADGREREERGRRADRAEPLPVATVPAAVTVRQDPLALQRVAGNRVTAALLDGALAERPRGPSAPGLAGATARRRLHRMPTREAVIKKLGKPSRLPTEGKKYKALLHALVTYHVHLRDPYRPGAVREQLAAVLARLSAVDAAARAYQGFTSEKARYATGELTRELAKERELVSRTLVRMLTAPPNWARDPGTVGELLLLHVGSKPPPPVRLEDRYKAGNQRGGSAEVTEYALPGGDAFFKPGKNTLETRPDAAILADLQQQGVPNDQVQTVLGALQNERELAVGTVGIDPTNARMGDRDTAMYRLNQLLGERVIARAQKAVRSDGTTGSLMDKAKGQSGARLMARDKMGKDATEAASKGAGAVNQRDPNLMRLMSKLQVIDLLAYQVDRNPANYWIQQDPATGEVTGITGIDNDLALGTTATLARAQELPGFSRYVDKELAERVLALDLSLLPAVFGDLLSPAEIDALTARFGLLKQKLAEVSTRLLEPDQWDDAVAKGLLQEKRSYWADIEYNKSKYGPQQ